MCDSALAMNFKQRENAELDIPGLMAGVMSYTGRTLLPLFSNDVSSLSDLRLIWVLSKGCFSFFARSEGRYRYAVGKCRSEIPLAIVLRDDSPPSSSKYSFPGNVTPTRNCHICPCALSSELNSTYSGRSITEEEKEKTAVSLTVAGGLSVESHRSKQSNIGQIDGGTKAPGNITGGSLRLIQQCGTDFYHLGTAHNPGMRPEFTDRQDNYVQIIYKEEKTVRRSRKRQKKHELGLTARRSNIIRLWNHTGKTTQRQTKKRESLVCSIEAGNKSDVVVLSPLEPFREETPPPHLNIAAAAAAPPPPHCH
ncbi:hypothetical protein J6590_024201 [Homalodisca vitripennis]|nr:hypothetical protein J6590_024201 [Homalodisca vitripennis]